MQHGQHTGASQKLVCCVIIVMPAKSTIRDVNHVPAQVFKKEKRNQTGTVPQHQHDQITTTSIPH